MRILYDNNYRGEDFYTELGVDKNATKFEIQKAYRALSKTFHPEVIAQQSHDEAKLEELRIKWKHITYAYTNLNSERTRPYYDLQGYKDIQKIVREGRIRDERKAREDPGKEAREQEQREREAREKAAREEQERIDREMAAEALRKERELAEEEAYAEAERRAEANTPTLKKDVGAHRKEVDATREDSNLKMKEAIREHRRRQRIDTEGAKEGVQQHREGQRSNGGESEI